MYEFGRVPIRSGFGINRPVYSVPIRRNTNIGIPRYGIPANRDIRRMSISGFGSLPLNENLTIAANKKYTFVFSSFKTVGAVKNAIGTSFDPYASGISVTGSGLSTIYVNLVPINNMPFYAWKNLFDEVGLSDMTDMYVGEAVPVSSPLKETISSPVSNVTQYWEPKIEAAGTAIKNVASSAANAIPNVFGNVKTIAIAGAVIGLTTLAIIYMPRPRR